MSVRIPLMETNSPWRGVIDLARRAYPGFAFGGGVDSSILPVFHFHEVTKEYLEPHLAYLRDNGYRAVSADAVARFVRDGVHPGEKSVALNFDDAWASAWTVATPLLRQYGLMATTFVVPARVPKADILRQTIADAGGAPRDVDRSSVPFATWPELRAMQGSGVWDIQAHTFAHAMVFSEDARTGFVTPNYQPHIHNAPDIGKPTEPYFLTAADAGAPLYAVRSRMSDVLRYDDPDMRKRCCDAVRAAGGAAFFENPRWQSVLKKAAGKKRGTFETPAERAAAIRADLIAAREMLHARLRTNTVKHICFPWAIAGSVAEEIAGEVGYESAYADVLGGVHAAVRGGNPYRIMRLKHKFIFSLPGRGRRSWWNMFRKR